MGINSVVARRDTNRRAADITSRLPAAMALVTGKAVPFWAVETASDSHARAEEADDHHRPG